MHYHAVCFVDHNDVCIFIENFQRDFLRLGFGGFGFWYDDLNFIAARDAVLGFSLNAVEKNIA